MNLRKSQISHKFKRVARPILGFLEEAAMRRPELALVQRHLLADLNVVEFGTSIGVVACNVLSEQSPNMRRGKSEPCSRV